MCLQDITLWYSCAMNTKVLKKRRKTRSVMVGGVGIGGNNPIRVQTMTNTDTLDIKKNVTQINACAKAGAELVRIAVPTLKHVDAFAEIKKQVKVPLIADVHFLPEVAFAVLKIADKLRINPGNFDKKQLAKLARQSKIPIRIGVNHGSIKGDMVKAAIEYAKIFRENNFNDLVISVKSSDPLLMIATNRRLAKKLDEEGMNYPIHLGVTEAGNASEGRAKSIIGIGTLLLDGIGDTIRVSLTEDPANEIPVCYDILQATGRRITRAEFVSCPSCGRTLFDIEKVTNEIKKKLGHLAHLKGVKIAIMGCIVNGLGEMGDADFGYVGAGSGKVNLYKKGKIVKRNVSEKDAVKELLKVVVDVRV
ncbi:4-hydroxy-3-methylbut-2-en-1-yl diphosphate synthase [bacterium]|nr:4-hydroxy-3-methylbut-2-en-1-yl diphosphate synthase [bacterium]